MSLLVFVLGAYFSREKVLRGDANTAKTNYRCDRVIGTDPYKSASMICLFLVLVRSLADMHLSFLSAKIHTACVQIFFSERVINCWNSLPDSVDFSSFTMFRRTVKQVAFTRFLRLYFSLCLQ